MIHPKKKLRSVERKNKRSTRGSSSRRKKLPSLKCQMNQEKRRVGQPSWTRRGTFRAEEVGSPSPKGKKPSGEKMGGAEDKKNRSNLKRLQQLVKESLTKGNAGGKNSKPEKFGKKTSNAVFQGGPSRGKRGKTNQK